MNPQRKKRGIKGSPCCSPSPFNAECLTPLSTFHCYSDGVAYKSRTNGMIDDAVWSDLSFLRIAALRSDNSTSVVGLWLRGEGACPSLQCLLKRRASLVNLVEVCISMHFATRRRKHVPAAMPRTPPVGSRRATSLADMNALVTLGVSWALAKLWAALMNSPTSSLEMIVGGVPWPTR